MTSRKAAQAGGVAVALSEVMTSTKGLWFGWSGEIADEPADVALETDRQGVTLATLAMTPVEHESFYLGYANSVLWPVFHNRLDLAKFDAGYFDGYVGFNRRAAEALAPLLRPDDIIWVHDYHFLPLAGELRKLGVRTPIGFFLHIKMPPVEAYLAIPEHRALSTALSHYDLVGVHTSRDVQNALACMAESAGAQLLGGGRVRIAGRSVTFDNFPIGIDANFFKPKRLDTKQAAPGPTRILGVDRLDYSKGLPQKFRAFRRFLEIHPEHHRAVVLTQIAAPTRDAVGAYTSIRRELEQLSGAVNGAYGDLDWVPAQYIHRAATRRRLPEIYRSAAVALVTPLSDGMNLMAKEYVAAQNPQDPGVLILSQFAGSAEQMQKALIVNPHDIGEMADAIHRALAMSRDERMTRHAALMTSIEAESSEWWWRRFVSALRDVAKPAGLRPIAYAAARLSQSTKSKLTSEPK
jgi:trehalose 6-phosphate synthase